jgi:hypothetical protein
MDKNIILHVLLHPVAASLTKRASVMSMANKVGKDKLSASDKELMEKLVLMKKDDGDTLSFSIPVTIQANFMAKAFDLEISETSSHPGFVPNVSTIKDPRVLEIPATVHVTHTYKSGMFSLLISNEKLSFSADNIREISDWYPCVKETFNLFMESVTYDNLRVWAVKQLTETNRQVK